MFSVLLVEDDLEDARQLNEFLARAGVSGASRARFNLTHASTLAQASADLQDRAWDLVLLDLSLPDSRGLETLSAIRELSTTPVVILTADDRSQLAEEAVQAGAHGCLVKWNFDGSGLWQAMSDAIEESRADQSLEERVLQTQRLESLGVLAGGVAHDFNNMMTVVSGFAELIKLNATGTLREYADRIQDVSFKASSLANQMLAYARRDTRPPSILDLSRAVSGMKDLLVAAGGWRGATLSFDLSPDPCLLRANPSQVEQVLLNLITNASEACTETGGHGQVRVTTRSEWVEDCSEFRTFRGRPLAPGQYSVLSISDNGAGVSPELVEKIFEPSYTSKVQGRGLGLAVVASTVREHNAGLRLETSPRGTRFDLAFPRPSEHEEAPVSEVEVPSAWRGRGRVLHVEDEPMVQESTQLLLEALGLEVSTASNGTRALEIYSAAPPSHFDLVLVDLTMPGISGIDLVHAIHDLNRQSQIVLSSGNSKSVVDHDPIAKSLPFLQKPYSLAELQELLKEILEQR